MMWPNRHREERSDAAIQNAVGRSTFPGLLGWTAPSGICVP